MAELKKLRPGWDPFPLGKLIDQKLQRIYDLANRRLSPKVPAENRGAQAKEKTQRGRRNGCGRFLLAQLLEEQADRFNPAIEIWNVKLFVRGMQIVVRKTEAHHHGRNLQHVLEVGDDGD